MNVYVLDTSALFAYIEDEEGALKIESLFKQALDGEMTLFISVISSIEVFYISWQEQGEQIATERLELIDALPIRQEPLDRELTKIIGEIKATHAMSFADCCIAGLAKIKQATLIHKDPEYEHVGELIAQMKLPYKQSSAGQTNSSV